jgi:4-hydroxyacetophenone monooxygenase
MITSDTAAVPTPDGEGLMVDDALLDQALAEADLNALRLALYQATGDEELAEMPISRVEVNIGARDKAVLDTGSRAELRRKLVQYLRDGARPGPIPDDAKLRRMLALLTGKTLSDVQFAYHRTILAFEDFVYGANWHGEPPVIPEGFEVAIIGAGVSGIATGIQFERLGIPYTIYERRGELGGTWSINTYPDARVDTTNFVYQYSFVKNYPWTEYFARGGEVRNYLENVARRFGVYDHIRFDSDVREAHWDEDSAIWTLAVADTKVKANVVIAASGLFGVPKVLNLPGQDRFKGEIVHTTRWRGDIDLRGRNVAILGNGSTGVQLLAKVASQAKQVTVYQRTPQWISPRERYGEPITSASRWLLDTVPHYWNWTIYSLLDLNLSAQALQEFDAEWQRKGGAVNERNDHFRDSLKKYIRDQLEGDEDLIAKVTPDYPPLARRLIVDNGWYTALLRDNVELVTDEIDGFTEDGIRVESGTVRPTDLVIAATGFQATKYVWPMQYYGRKGRRLEEFWESEGAPRAYLGMAVPDFPNLFIHYGPNAQPRAGSLMAWQEVWSQFSAQSVVDMLEGGHRAISIKPEVYERYNADLDEASLNIVWSDPSAGARNYYVDAKGRSSVNAPWRMEDYYQYFLNRSLDDFEVS